MRARQSRILVWISTAGLISGALLLSGCSMRMHHWIFGRFEGANPRFSPDGSSILFSSLETGHGDIYTVRPDGADPQRLTRSRAWEGFAEWSPDGQSIAFIREHPDELAVWVMDRDGGSQRRIGGAAGWIHHLVVSPDASRVAYFRSWWVDKRPFQDLDSGESRSQLRVAWSDGSGEAVIWEGSPAIRPVRFSSDGRELEVRSRAPLPNELLAAEEFRLVPSAASPERPKEWSPDGAWYLDTTWDHHRPRRGELWMIPRDGSERRLLAEEHCIISDFSFSADGDHVLYFAETGNVGLGEICVVDVEGSNRRVVGSSKAHGILHASGRPLAFLVSIPAGLAALILWGI